MAKSSAQRSAEHRARKKAEAAISAARPLKARAPVKSSTVRSQEYRARKKLSQTKPMADADRRFNRDRIRRFRMALIKSTHNVAVGSTEAGTVERMLYLKDLSTEARKARQVKANENFQRWRLRKKENNLYWMWLYNRRKRNAENMKRYRLGLTAEQRTTHQRQAVLRSRSQRTKHKARGSNYVSYMFNKYNCDRAYASVKKRKERQRRYRAAHSDTTTTTRSRKRRWCGHPPCKVVRLVDGIVHFGKYCPYLYPGARQRQLEAMAMGESSVQFDPNPRVVYYDGWYRSYAKQYLHPAGDYTYPIFKNELGERVCAGVDDRNLLCIYHCESEGDDDDSDASSQEDDGSTGTDGSDENSSWR
jgi:hypothetical protein